MQTMTASVVHPFQAAGLGQAPFRLIGVAESVYHAHPGAPAQPGSSCDYCSTAIRYVCQIASADGKRFKVGCDCVQKLGRADNRLITAVEAQKRAIDKAKRDAKAEARRAVERERIAAAFARLDDARPALVSQPHPSIDRDGFTLLGYVEWLRDNAGHTGRVKAAGIIEATLNG